MGILYEDFKVNSPRPIEDMKNKIHARAREVFQHRVGNSLCAGSNGKRRKISGSSKKFTAGEMREEREMRILGPGGLAWLLQVAYVLIRKAFS